MEKLSHVLLDLGFFCALGTSEHPGLAQQEVHVKRGKPCTYDSNNGVTAFYDEEGWPWIIRSDLFTYDMAGKIGKYLHTRGAYVPHSNDGGHFVLEVLPNL